MVYFWPFKSFRFRVEGTLRTLKKSLFVLVGSFLFVGCSQENSYLYPTPEFYHLDQACKIVVRRGGKDFSVEQGRMYAHFLGQGRFLVMNHTTALSDGLYRCGRAEPSTFPCAVGTTQTLGGGRCQFESS